MTSYQGHMPLKELPNRMRGVQVDTFGGPDVLNVRSDLPLPIKDVKDLKPTQVLVCTHFSGINPVDTYIRSGQYARLPNLPYIPGCDAAGYIEAAGSHVNNEAFAPSSRVFVTGPGQNSGSYAGYLITDANYVFPLHERMSFAQGAGLGVPYFTAYKAIVLGARTKEGETVLVHGASGAVGTAAVQIARSLGANVVGTAGTEEGMNVVKGCGAHHVFNHRDKDYVKAMVKTTNGEGFDVIVENLANVNLETDMQMLKKNARIMIIGSRGAININPRHLMAPEASIQGVALAVTTAEQYQLIGSAIVDGISQGWVNPVINRVYDMKDVKEAHNDIINSAGAKGNLVLKLQ